MFRFVQDGSGNSEIQLSRQQFADIAFGAVHDAFGAEQFACFETHSAAQADQNRRGRIAQMARQINGRLQLTYAQQQSRLIVIAQVAGQCLKVSAGFSLPAVIEVHGQRGEQLLTSIFEIFLRFTQEELREPTAFIVDRVLLVVVVLQGFDEILVVHHFLGVLEPAEE